MRFLHGSTLRNARATLICCVADVHNASSLPGWSLASRTSFVELSRIGYDQIHKSQGLLSRDLSRHMNCSKKLCIHCGTQLAARVLNKKEGKRLDVFLLSTRRIHFQASTAVPFIKHPHWPELSYDEVGAN
eukprot:3022321-Amphidinium_carterae.2